MLVRLSHIHILYHLNSSRILYIFTYFRSCYQTNHSKYCIWLFMDKNAYLLLLHLA